MCEKHLTHSGQSDTLTISGEPRFKRVEHPRTGKLLFKYDPQRELIEYAERRENPVYIDLMQFKEAS